MAEPVKTLVTAFVSRWTAAGTLSGIAGPYYGEAPTSKASTMPRCTFTCRARLERQTVANEYWRHRVEIKVVDTTPENCATQAALIRAVYDPDSLVTAGTMSLAEGAIIEKRFSETEYHSRDKAVTEGRMVLEFLTSKPRVP